MIVKILIIQLAMFAGFELSAQSIPTSISTVSATTRDPQNMIPVFLDGLLIPIIPETTLSISVANSGTFPKLVEGDIYIGSQADLDTYYLEKNATLRAVSSGGIEYQGFNIVGLANDKLPQRGIARYRIDATTFDNLNVTTANPIARQNAETAIRQAADQIFNDTGIMIVSENEVQEFDYSAPPIATIFVGSSNFYQPSTRSINYTRDRLVDAAGNVAINTTGTLVHELLHLIGVQHEMLRPNIAVLAAINTDRSDEFQFGFDQNGNFVGTNYVNYTAAYDPTSIMTYPRNAASICDQPLPNPATNRTDADRYSARMGALLGGACSRVVNMGGVNFNVPIANIRANGGCDVACRTIPTGPINRSTTLSIPGDRDGLASMFPLNSSLLPLLTASGLAQPLRVSSAQVVARLISLNSQALANPAANNTIQHQVARQINQTFITGTLVLPQAACTASGTSLNGDVCENTACVSLPSNSDDMFLAGDTAGRCPISYSIDGRTACQTARATAGFGSQQRVECGERTISIFDL